MYASLWKSQYKLKWINALHKVIQINDIVRKKTHHESDRNLKLINHEMTCKGNPMITCDCIYQRSK